MSLTDQLRALARYAWLIAVLAVVGAVAAAAVALLSPQSYESRVRMAIGPIATDDRTQLSAATSTLNDPAIAATVSEMARGAVTAPGVSTSAVASNGSNVVTATVRGPSKSVIREASGQLFSTTSTRLSTSYPMLQLTQLGEPSAPTSTRASLSLAAAAGMVTGLLVGYLAALVLAARSPAGTRRGGNGSSQEPTTPEIVGSSRAS